MKLGRILRESLEGAVSRLYQTAFRDKIKKGECQGNERRKPIMARITRAAAHLSLEEVKDRLRNDPRAWCRERWLIIYNALVDPRKAENIAKHCGVSKATVHQVISTYNRFGVKAVETAGKGGRRHQYLTLEAERAFLAPFFARAETGESATAAEIQQAFEARVGHEVEDSTIYRLLKRHGWRKLVPRPRHPQASKEAQEAFKKTLRRRCKRLAQRDQLPISGPSCCWLKMRDAADASVGQNAAGHRPSFVLAPPARWCESPCTSLPPSFHHRA